MTAPEFYCLSPPGAEGGLYGNVQWAEKYMAAEFVEGSIDYEQISCPLEPEHGRAGKRIGDLQLVLPTPHIPDFIWTIMSECVVTDRVLKLFRDAGFTGFETRQATIAKVRRLRRNSSLEIPNVWEFLVRGKGGDARPDSGVHLLYVCPSCGLTRYSSFRNGIIVSQNQWDGSDFFTINGYPRFILVTEGVKDLIIQNRLTNCVIQRSSDLQWGASSRPEDHPEAYLPRRRVTG